MADFGFWTMLATATFWFWAIFVVESVILLVAIEYQKGFPATLSLFASLLLLHFVGGVDIFGSLFKNPLLTAQYVAGYFAAGAVYAVFKWWRFVRGLRKVYNEYKVEFLRQRGIQGTEIPANLKVEWKQFLTQQYVLRHMEGMGLADGEFPPQARRHKSRILVWMSYWPWSLVWTIVGDLVVSLFEEIYHLLLKLLQAISYTVFRGTENELPTRAEEEEWTARRRAEADEEARRVRGR